MRDISQVRISLAEIHNLESELKHYLNHYVSKISGEVNEESRKNILYYLTGENIFNESLILKLASSWSVFEKTPDALTLSDLLKKVIGLTHELTTLNSLNLISEQVLKIKAIWDHYQVLSKPTQEQIKTDYKKLTQIHLLNAKTWSASQQVVFHAVKVEYVDEILDNQKIKGHTSQRYWSDGKRRQETDDTYQDSLWMKGISTTRSLEFAINWASVVLVFNLHQIKTNKEVVPYAWNFHVKGDVHKKKETEEFIVLNKTGKQFRNFEDPEFMAEYEEAMKSSDPEVVSHYQKEYNKINLHHLKSPQGELDISKSLMGIFISGSLLDIYGVDNPIVQKIINYPLFIGILEN